MPRLDEAIAVRGDAGRGAAEYRIRAKDGGERWLLDRFTLVTDEDGDPVAQEGILLDVTDQHLVEDELRASRRELELHAAIATIFLTAPPDQMFTEVLSVVREAVGARWGFFGYLDGRLAGRAVARRGGLGRLPRRGQAPAVPATQTWSDNTWSRALRDRRRPRCSPARASCPRGTCP